MLGTLGYGALMGVGDGTLGAGDVVRAIVGRYLASIFCRVLMDCYFSSPIANGDTGSGFLRASIKSSIYWHAT